MVLTSRRRGFTLVELLVVIVIIGMLVGLLVPAVLRTRETARRALCANNLKQVGVALQAYEEQNGRYPPGCAMLKPMSTGQLYETFSIFAYLLPFLGEESLYSRINVRTGYSPWGNDGYNNGTSTTKWMETVRNTQLNALRCPSFSSRNDIDASLPHKGFSNVSGQSVKGAITNFKMIGDTFKEGIAQAVKNAGVSISVTVPPGGHPNGVFYPASPTNGLKLSDIPDGLSNTLFAAETIEQQYARWLFGTEVLLGGMPLSTVDSTNGVQAEQLTQAVGYIWGPHGFDGNFDESSAISPQYKTYLSYDYTDNTKYYDDKTDSTAKIKYGASSTHSGVVNHLFGDGVVRAIRTNVDVAIYYFMITRNANEPYVSPYIQGQKL